MRFLYTFSIHVLTGVIHLAALFNDKARKWVSGRADWRKKYRDQWAPGDAQVLWVHAASLGEFEQGRPVIEAFRAEYPDWKIVLTFFSPSGYEIRKNYPHADFVFYLPADTPGNARDFLDIIRPSVAIFIKYEFWANYLFTLKGRGTPTLLVSALFRPEQLFFKGYGGFWRQMLSCFSHFFVQQEASAKLLESIGFQNITVAGDTRVDRVLSIAEQVPENAVAAAFTEGLHPGQVFIVGSSWEADEAVYLPVLQQPEFAYFKTIIAPHEPGDAHVSKLENILQVAGVCIRYSKGFNEKIQEARYLLIDNIGLLNTLYRYGTVAYIGGGFGKGIHNTLEPAAFGLPVIFGPNYGKFEEARQLVARGGAFPINNSEDLAKILLKLQNPDSYKQASVAAKSWLEENRGATRKVLSYLSQIQGKKP